MKRFIHDSAHHTKGAEMSRVVHQRSKKRYLERKNRQTIRRSLKVFGTIPDEIKTYDTPHLKGKQIKPPSSLNAALRFRTKKCPICGWNEYPEAFVIHHIDHNRHNNDLSNLIVLCRNCHFLVHRGLKELPSRDT